jgi:hypothetical protein
MIAVHHGISGKQKAVSHREKLRAQSSISSDGHQSYDMPIISPLIDITQETNNASVSVKYAFIDAECAAACAPTVERMCRWLQVSRSGYYEWLHRPPSAAAQRRQLL